MLTKLFADIETNKPTHLKSFFKTFANCRKRFATILHWVETLVLEDCTTESAHKKLQRSCTGSTIYNERRDKCDMCFHHCI